MSLRLSFPAVMALLCLMTASTLFAQQKKGSIEDAWNKSASEKRVTHTQPRAAVPAPQGVHPQDVDPRGTRPQPFVPVPADTTGNWKKIRVAEPRPWTANTPLPKNLHEANGMLIDSLAHLYCLPQSYIRSLHGRNDAAKGSPAPTATKKKEFDYKAGQRAQAEPAHARSSATLESLHRELQQLLEQCLRRN